MEALNTVPGATLLSATVARLSALLSAGHRLTEDLEDGASPDDFDRITALQCVIGDARRELNALTETIHQAPKAARTVAQPKKVTA